MIGCVLLFLQLAVTQTPNIADSAPKAPFAQGKVPEAVLAEQRGGLRLPNGIDVALSIDMLTALDGAIVLQTVIRIDEGAPVVTVYAPDDGQTIAMPKRESVAMTGAQPSVTYDRQYGLRVTGGDQSAPVSFTTLNGKVVQHLAAGLKPIDPSEPVETTNGLVQTLTGRGFAGVELRGADIHILHLTESVFGSAVANSGNNRTIDTQTTLSIDLRNAGPDVLGSTMLRVENVMTEALAGRL